MLLLAGTADQVATSQWRLFSPVTGYPHVFVPILWQVLGGFGVGLVLRMARGLLELSARF